MGFRSTSQLYQCFASRYKFLVELSASYSKDWGDDARLTRMNGRLADALASLSSIPSSSQLGIALKEASQLLVYA